MADREFVRVRFATPGERTYSRGFYAMAGAVGDMSPVMERIGDDVRQGVLAQFTTEGAAKGSPWAPLEPEYGRWKDAHYPGAPILVQTGQMRSQALNPSALRTTRTSMRYEPGGRVWRYHQSGTSRMPRRPLVVITPNDRRQWDRYWAEWLAAAREAWLR